MSFHNTKCNYAIRYRRINVIEGDRAGVRGINRIHVRLMTQTHGEAEAGDMNRMEQIGVTSLRSLRA